MTYAPRPMDYVRDAIYNAATSGVDMRGFAAASDYADTPKRFADTVNLLALSYPDPHEEHGLHAFRTSVLDGPVQDWCLQWVQSKKK